MDDLYSCYRSNMRLYPDDPDRLTPGRWLWCPEGAEALPFPTAFCSSRYDPNDWELEGVGEVSEILGYSSGRTSPRYTGLTHCGSAHLFAVGSPVILRGTPAVDAEGVPLCCAAPPAVGGQALGGVGTFGSWYDVAVWLRPESIEGLSDGDPVPAWPDSGVRGNNYLSGGLPFVTKQTDGVTGLAYGLFAWNATLGSVNPPVSLAPAATLFLVTARGIHFSQSGIRWIGPGVLANSVLAQTAAAVTGSTSHGGLSFGFTSDPNVIHLVSLTVGPAGIGLYLDGELVASGPADPVALVTIGALGVATTLFPTLNSANLFEALAWDRQLSDGEFSAVTNYLLTKYSIMELDTMPTGAIIAFGGSPPPAGYLICDGSAVSRTTYAALFGVIGTTWGAGDGVTTFGLPDLRGRAGIGAGTGSGLSPRTLADTGGEENHTQLVGELATHQHGLTDPGHTHTVPTGGGTAVVDNTIPFLNVADTTGTATGSAFTGISMSDTGSADPMNVMQPFAVVQYLIKT